MGVGRQSRRVCFGAKPDKGFLDKKNLAVSGSGKGTRTRVDDATQREAVGGWSPGERVGGWTRERVGGWTREWELVAGPERELVAGPENESWWLESREAVGGWRGERQAAEGSGDWTGERRTEKLAWIHGGAVNTRHRAERRGDKIGSSEEESQDVWFQ